VTLSTELSETGRTALLHIIDNGGGITPAAARKIFRPGFTTKKRGWGMGLTLVKRIIEEYHSGRILLLRSKPGETVFQIELPVISNKGK
jgi:signal transduction histidine kinase